MDATLVIMAAGIGSRFGGGIKQLAPVGPNGEIIMEYSIYDALKAGFNKVVFIIRKDIEQDFKEVVGDKISKIVKVEYTYQELEDLPKGFSAPSERKKPWGTGQAVLSAKNLVHEPFVVINADDYYGAEGFREIYAYMQKEMTKDGDIFQCCMAGFILENTLSENGGVTRGVCTTDEDKNLVNVTETFEIGYRDGKLHAENEAGEPVFVDAKQPVSMNMWGLPAAFIGLLEEEFVHFLDGLSEKDIKKEFLLPTVIDCAVKEGKASVKVLKTEDKWFGVTYKEDKDFVIASIQKLIADGVYPKKLF